MVARQRGVGLGFAVAGVLGQLVVTAVAVAQPSDGTEECASCRRELASASAGRVGWERIS